MSKEQSTVALSAMEAEYIAASLCMQEAIWLRALLQDLSFEQKEVTVLKEHNQGTIALSKNSRYHARVKHIDISHHFLRDRVEKSDIVLSYCPTQEMAVDVLTEPLGKIRFEKLRQLMGMACDI